MVFVFALVMVILFRVLQLVEIKRFVIDWTRQADIWIILTAIGTTGATAVAILLALLGIRKDRDEVARVVAAWVTDEYEPREDGTSYERVVRVHIANQSNEPVFDARLNVVIGRDKMRLGPLSAPTPISVIPPRRELVYDISIPLLAHGQAWNPLATLYFTDPQARRWFRTADGKLQDVSKEKSGWSSSISAFAERQLGEMSSMFNPISVAMDFLASTRSSEFNKEEVLSTLAPEATGWEGADWGKIGDWLARYQPTSMVDYPAPRIARIKLSGDVELEGRHVEGEGAELDDVLIMTLTFSPIRGWRVFGIGEMVLPHEILFEGGSLLDDVWPQIRTDEGPPS